MFKWFREQITKADNRANDKVIKALQIYKEIPADKPFKKANKIENIFIAIKTAKGYEISTADYIGGFYKMEDAKKEVKITIVDDTLILKYNDGILILINDIVEVSINSKEQISHRVTATRFLATGLLALAIPKKRVDILQYLVIKFKDNGTEQEIILAGENLGNLYSELYKRVGKIGA